MLKNYTSTVSAEKSVQRIERLLVQHGARNVFKEYDGLGTLVALMFSIETSGRIMAFKIPIKVYEAERIMKESVKKPRKDTFKNIKRQAEMTAWKLASDWVEVQLSYVTLGQVEFLQVFLPYVYDPVRKETFFEKMKGGGFKLLPQTFDGGE